MCVYDSLTPTGTALEESILGELSLGGNAPQTEVLSGERQRREN